MGGGVGGGGESPERLLPVGGCAQPCQLPTPTTPRMEQALIVLNVDYSRTMAPQGQILAKMIDRPWSGKADDV